MIGVEQWLLVIVMIATLSSLFISAQSNEVSELPEDCDQSLQYFHTVEAKCRNCSDAMRLFEPGYRDWQLGATGNSEAITIAGPTTTTGANNNNNNSGQAARQQHRNSIISSVIGTRLTPLPPNGGVHRVRPGTSQQTSDAMLSRLVMASPRDTLGQEPPALLSSEDTGGPPTSGDDETFNLPQLVPDKYQEADTDGRRRVGDEQARMWHIFLTSFVRSRELAQLGLLEAIGQCRLDAISGACQMWSNMCVLTMYSHTDVAVSSSSSTANSASTASARATSFGRGTMSRSGAAATSWQECPKFGLSSICNSLRDWHRNEKSPGLSEVADIFYDASGGADAELLLPEGGGAARGPGGVPLVPFKLDQLIQLLAYEYALDGRLVRVSQFDLRDLSKFCLFSPSASLPVGNGSESLRDLGDQPSPARQNDDYGNDRETSPPNENNNNNNSGGGGGGGGGGGQDQLHEIRVGRSAGLVCRFSALQAAAFAPVHLNQTKFVDLFIGYQLNGATFIRPVPILLKNLLIVGPSVSLPNVRYAQDPTRWKLVHRYFPLASVSLDSQAGQASESNKTSRVGYGYDNDDATPSSSANNQQRALVYARDAKLDIKFKLGPGSGLVISSMLLHLDYDFILIGKNRGHSILKTKSHSDKRGHHVINIRVTQSQADMPGHLKDLDLMLAIVCLASCIWSLIRCYNIQKYQGLIKLDIYSLALFLIIACDIIANLVALLTGLFALYLFASSKLSPGLLAPLQQQHLLPVMMPPDEATQQNLLAKLKLALALKLAGLLYKLHVRLNVDLFFIDWERPKMLTSNQLLTSHHLHNQASKQRPHQSAIDSSGSKQQFQQISFWRPYFIINRWLRIQTWRRQCLTLQLLALVCCLQFGASLDQLATSDANSRLTASGSPTGHEHAAVNPLEPQLVPDQCPVFRCLLLALIYLILACAQIVYKRIVYEPMFRCAVREFLDLCSVANVSLFAMLYPRYGFYLHGRNANGSADCGLAEMNVMLEREERNLCSKRGLLPNSDQQTFIMVLPKIINDHYRKLLFRNEFFLNNTGLANNSSGLMMATRRPLSTTAQQADDSAKLLTLQQQQQQFGAKPELTRFSSSFIESVVARNKAINVFLVNFLDHIYKDIDYSVRERRRFESLLELELDLSAGDEEADHDAAPRKAPPSNGLMMSMMMGGVNAAAGVQRPGETLAASQRVNAATLFVDRGHSFASLLWLGLEWDLLLVELLALLHLDLMLGKENLILTVSLVWLGNKLFQWLYAFMARKNLVTKSMLDEKFLIRP